MLQRASFLAASALLLAACAGQTGEPGPMVQAARLPPKAVTLPPPPPAIETLLQADKEAIRALFGEPHFARRDVSADVWQYGAEGCSLLLFFYPNGEGVPTVEYTEARDARTGAESDLKACVASVARAHREVSGAGTPTS